MKDYIGWTAKDYIGWVGAPKYIVQWSPLALFANGEQGAWYDPSDLSTLYQDSAGTTPVTALGQPVGLMLDKSGRGNHAGQPTATARPTIQARVNLLEQTEDFTSAKWLKLGAGAATAATITGNYAVAPDGTATAARLQASRSGSTPSDYSLLQQDRSPVPGIHCASIWVKSNTGAEQDVYFRTSGDAVRRVTTEWQRIEVADDTTTQQYLTIGTRGGTATNASVDILVWHPQVEIGSTATTYQRVTTATDYADVGAKRYLQFDGVDDFLVTGNIDFTGTDKVTVVAGVRKLSNAARGVVVELTNASTNRFGMEAPGAGLNNFLWATGGTSVPANVSYATDAPSTKVLTGIGDISADTAILRADGAQVASQTTDQGTGNYANAVLYIGRRGGATLPFNGNLYSLLIRGAASTAAQIASAERYAAVKTGVTLA